MSDDLTPAAQARAARWAKNWLADAGFDVFDTALDAMSSLSFHADKLDPPETVESLRAEQDKVVAQFEMVLVERNKARENVEYWREQFRLVCDESACRLGDRNVAREKLERAECVIRDHSAALDALRAERDEVWRKVLNLQAELDERQDAAAEREPRVWLEDDPEPEGVQQVRDMDGAKWFNNDGVWIVEGDGRTWARIARNYAPLTEVLDED